MMPSVCPFLLQQAALAILMGVVTPVPAAWPGLWPRLSCSMVFISATVTAVSALPSISRPEWSQGHLPCELLSGSATWPHTQADSRPRVTGS